MKKYLVFLLVFVFIVTFTAAPKNVIAVPHPNGITPKPEVWEWYAEGVFGEEVPMVKITTTPREWYQLRSNGLKVDGATRICHGFDDGRYGWTGEIFRLVEDAWVKLPTTVGWVPTEEGHYMACAMAPAAGTYALFGYFDKAKAPVKQGLPVCDSWGSGLASTWIPPTFFSYDAYINVPESAFVPVTYTVIDSNYPLSGDLTATVLADISGHADFEGYQWQILVPWTHPIFFTIHVETPDCYFDWLLNYY